MAAHPKPIAVVVAADDNYALPLAVTVQSALDSLPSDAHIELYVIDGGISPESRQRLLESWNDSRLRVRWLEFNLSLLDGMKVSGHVTRMTYARLLLPQLLPVDLERVIYLDSDLIVLHELAKLWQQPVDGVACGACQDPSAPWLDAEHMLPNYSCCGRFLSAARPIPNFHELGLDACEPYFNAGVLLVNLRYWREHSITERAIECLHANQPHVLWWDQYALNVVLHRRWRALDIRWNQGTVAYRFPSHLDSPLDLNTYYQLRYQPWIVHFSAQIKPWHYECDHPYRSLFFEIVDRTSWKDWRPANPYRGLTGWLRYEYRQYKKWRRNRRIDSGNSAKSIKRHAAQPHVLHDANSRSD
jgi:lipopolysaccharide biosynthesis glycosyltransferase